MATNAPSPLEINAMQRAAVLGNSQKMKQLIRSVTVDPDDEPIVTVPVRAVGLVLGFIVEVSGGVTNGAGTQADRTGFGSSNVVKTFTFTDIDNNQRIRTTGSHIALLNTARQGFAFGGAYAPNLPMAYGNTWTPFAGPASIAANGVANVKHTYYVPLAYSSSDLRGAMYAGVVNRTAQLQIELQANPFVGATDPLQAVYSGNATGDWTNNVTVNVYQIYLTNLPTIGNDFIVPTMDVSQIYELKNSSLTGLVAGQEFPVAYSSNRQFYSTMAIYDNGGVYNSGGDISYWSMKAANTAEFFRYTPDVVALESRQTFMADTPPGVYYFDHRDKPIDTLTYGTMELNINPLLVNANAQLVVYFEAFQQLSQLPISSSLAAG